jgi:hypothetical protein
MAERVSHSSITTSCERNITMNTTTAVRNEEWAGGDGWLGAYPPERHALLLKFGVPDPMDERAPAYNAALIAQAARIPPNDPRFAAELEVIFLEHFGGLLPALADKAAAAAGQGDPAVRHVDLDAHHQVSIANGIGHVMTRFRKRQVEMMAGFTVDARGAVRVFGGGRIEAEKLRLAVEHFRTVGIHHLGADIPPMAADAPRAAAGIVHTRDRREQQAAVARVVRDIRHRHREGEIEMVVGATVDHLGRIHPFGGGETDGRLVEAAIDAMKEFVAHNVEKRYDH